MARFILGNALRKAAAERPRLARALWLADLAVVGGLVRALGLLPPDRASALGRRLGRWVGPWLRGKSERIRDNLRIAFPEAERRQIDAWVREIWGEAGAVLAEYAHLDLLSDPAQGRLEVEIVERIPTYDDPSRPAVFVTAHLGNWELNAAAVASLGIRFISLYTPPANPWLDRLLKQSRAALGCELLPRHVNLRPLVKALLEGRSVAMVADRRIDEGAPVPFFGHPKPSTLLPARLALRHRCPLVPVRIRRLGGARFRVSFLPPVPPPAVGDEEAKALAMMAEVHRLFESWIREHPEEWFCTQRLWRLDRSTPQRGRSAVDVR
ncbi:MAG: lipid A biosynthesis lauroyl acyltransferase [Porticoccaceae bacterium]|nr:MAG: lipid A biosynthesis lauroyl acyltransferase [Porticoccaceae bacterium]